MKSILLRVWFVLIFAVSLDVTAKFAITDGDRVVIYGDSITAGAEYPNYSRYLETYIRTRFPKMKVRFWNRGWSGDVAGNFSRFQRDCLALKPTVILINMGMNDASYKADIAAGLKAFVANLTKMAGAARKENSNVRIYLVSPILYEYPVTRTRAYYPYVLWCYARQEKRLAKQLGVEFIDLNRAYGQTIGLAHAILPGSVLFSGDSIHPLPNGGHLFIAIHILRALGADPQLASLAIENGKVVANSREEAKVVTWSQDKVVIERKLDTLPMPTVVTYKGIPYLDQNLAFLECFADEFNRDILRVSGLQEQAYQLRIDGELYAELSDEQLEAGVNLSEFRDTPDMIQARKVMDLVGEKQILQHTFWLKHLKKRPTETAVKAFKTARETALAAVTAAAKPQTHRITLSKLDKKVDPYRRYERCYTVTVPAVLTVSNPPEAQAIPVSIKNVSNSVLRAELFWSDQLVQPSFQAISLKPGELRQLNFSAKPGLTSAPPTLTVKGCAADGSFPALIQETTVPLVSTVGVPQAAKAIKVDGNLDDWPAKPTFTLDNRLTRAVRSRTLGPDDLGANVHLSWDSDNLYIAVVVRDQDHVNHFSDNRMGWDDSVTVLIGKSGDARCFALTPDGPKMLPDSANSAAFAVKRQDLQTIYEIALPWKKIKDFKAKPGSECRFNISVNDRDSDESCKSVNWAGVDGARGRNLSGQLLLLGK